jgi:hypothetical protein
LSHGDSLRDQPFRKTHNLLELRDACNAIDPTINFQAEQWD